MIDLGSVLVRHGMSEPEALGKAKLFAKAMAALPSAIAGGQAFAAFVPGRIELLGKHTDYAGGRSLLCAAERGFCLLALPRQDSEVVVVDAASGARRNTVLAPRSPAIGTRPGDWGTYVSTVARRLAANFPGARRGADIAFASDLPQAAGMSSSSALVTSVLLALCAVNDLESAEPYSRSIRSREDLAEYLGTVENGQSFGVLSGDAGVGTFGGSEDHTAMLCSRAGELGQFRFCPILHERQVPMPAGCSLVVAVSGVAARKTGRARESYNRASLSASRVLDIWNKATGRRDPTLGHAIESAPDAADLVRDLLAKERRAHGRKPGLSARFAQFVEESEVLVPAVADLLAAGNVDQIGDVVARSQAGAEAGLGNQVPETMFLARSAREAGAVAASAFGAGFGGSVWAMAWNEQLDAFVADWSARYRRRFPNRARSSQFFVTRPGPAAVTLVLCN